jgi:pyruvate formate lyase activating enzyme
MNPISKSQTLEQYLAHYSREGFLYEKLDEKKVRCFACGHRCLMPDGRPGICRIRFNEGGILKVPYGYISGMNCDPIEKKPFFHVLPGSNAMSFGMLGCDFHCAYCQNWITSQAIRDEKAGAGIRAITPEELINSALRYGARSVTSTYNEPLITSEWAAEIFQLAKKNGFLTSYVSNGNGTPETIDYLHPWLDCYKVDVKSFRDKSYRQLGGTLAAVLDTIRLLKSKNIWVEIVTLLVPTFNDSEAEVRDIARFIGSVDRNIPWHITAFHEDYQMRGVGNTSVKNLLRSGEIGREEGLNFVYIGNIPGYAPEWENTSCPRCKALLVERCGYRIGMNRIKESVCPDCGESIPGIWNEAHTP